MEDDIKRKWQSTRVNLASDNASLDYIMEGKRKTALQDLAQRYRWFSNIALLCAGVVPLNMLNLHLFPDMKSRMVVVIWFCVFFLISSAMDRWLYNGIKRIDVATMQVSDVVAKAIYYRKWHIRFIFILLPLAFGCLGLTAYLIDDLFLRLGMIAGFIVGVAVGIRKLLDFLSDYKTLTSEY